MRRQLSTMACALLLGLWSALAVAEIVVVVSRESPIDTLEPGQLRDIYLGRTNSLADGTPIVPIDQAESTAAYAAFCRDYLGQSKARIKAHWSKRIFTGRGQPPRSVADGEAMARVVADNPSAIGYLDRELIDDRLRVVRVE